VLLFFYEECNFISLFRQYEKRKQEEELRKIEEERQKELLMKKGKTSKKEKEKTNILSKVKNEDVGKKTEKEKESKKLYGGLEVHTISTTSSSLLQESFDEVEDDDEEISDDTEEEDEFGNLIKKPRQSEDDVLGEIVEADYEEENNERTSDRNLPRPHVYLLRKSLSLLSPLYSDQKNTGSLFHPACLSTPNLSLPLSSNSNTSSFCLSSSLILLDESITVCDSVLTLCLKFFYSIIFMYDINCFT
jgi:hypothetical protein